MDKSSSVDLRVRIVGEIERGQSCRAAARRFGVSTATAIRLGRRKAQTGSLSRLLIQHGFTVKNVWPAPSAMGFIQVALIGLHQRIRHSGRAVAKMESRTFQAS